MDILSERFILTRRIVNQIEYGWEPYRGKVFYKIYGSSKSGIYIFFLTSSQISKIPLRHEIQMKFEVDFPGYMIDYVQPIYNINLNRIIYKCTIYSVEEETLNSDKLKKMLSNHSDYILNKTIWIR